jgi:hypothetical protein
MRRGVAESHAMVLTRIAFGYFCLMLILALVLPGH